VARAQDIDGDVDQQHEQHFTPQKELLDSVVAVGPVTIPTPTSALPELGTSPCDARRV
jgi:hypothetical protein